MDAPVNFDDARRVADAVLFEGYLLYPYRASAAKNQMRWQFGVVAPPGSASGDPSLQQTELVLEVDDDATLEVCVRFLVLETRRDEYAWDEGDVVEHNRSRSLRALVEEPDRTTIELPASRRDDDGIVRERRAISAAVEVSATRLPGPYGIARARIVVENTGAPPRAGDRDEVVRRSLVGTHVLVGVRGGRFVSSTDPPEWARPAVEQCTNVGAFPVVVGAAGDVMLSSPIILPDQPTIAPESAGPLFDATEIDEILVLRTLALGDAEKDEARRTDPRAAELIDRVEEMPAEVFERLHGAIRSMRPVPQPADEVVEIDGVVVRRGSHVRLHPRRGADAQDVFWADRTAVVTEVLCDLDGRRHVAVIADDDPGAEVRAWQGRYLYFDPSEIEPMGART